MRDTMNERVVVGRGSKWPCGGSLKCGVLFASDLNAGGVRSFFQVDRGSLLVHAWIRLELEAEVSLGSGTGVMQRVTEHEKEDTDIKCNEELSESAVNVFVEPYGASARDADVQSEAEKCVTCKRLTGKSVLTHEKDGIAWDECILEAISKEEAPEVGAAQICAPATMQAVAIIVQDD